MLVALFLPLNPLHITNHLASKVLQCSFSYLMEFAFKVTFASKGIFCPTLTDMLYKCLAKFC